MSLRNYVYILLLCVPGATLAQVPAVVDSIPLEDTTGLRMTTDNLGNIYLYRNDELVKFDADGRRLQRYSDKKLGRISSVDAGNPFKILVFYREQGVLRVLDNMLAPTGNLLRLAEANFVQPWLVTSSYNNNLWIYDRRNSSLFRTDLELKENYRLDNLQAITGMPLDPVAMDEYGNWLFIQDARQGILMFDIYGNYYRTIARDSLLAFQPREERLILHLDSGVVEYGLKFLRETPVILPGGHPGSVRFEKDRVFMVRHNQLFILRIP